MGKMKKPKQGEEDEERKGKKKRYSQIKPSAKTTMQTRKELRKQQRKAKKAKKFEFYSKKFKLDAAQQSVATKTNAVKATVKNKKQGQKPKQPKPAQPQSQSKKVKSSSEKFGDSHEQMKLEEQQLRKDMDAVRRKRLLEENLQEDKTIRKAEKILKINKKSKIPASFREDGLDYILELVSSSDNSKKDKKKKTDDSNDDTESEEDYDEMNDDDEDKEFSDVEESPSVTNKRFKRDLESEDDMESDLGEESDSEDNNEESVETGFADSESNPDSEEGSVGTGIELDSTAESDDSDEEDGATEKHVMKKKKKSKENEFWEDIYGRLRSKEGAVINEKTMQPLSEPAAPNGGKYEPPAKRGQESGRAKILRNLKGLLNRLSEGNMHNVSQQIEELYMSNSRNEMNESLLELLYASLLSDVIMPERLVWEHVMLVTILHANVGSEVGAFFVQNFIQNFREMYDQFENLEESKKLQNAVLLIAAIYHFKIVGCKLIFDVLEFMAKNFTPKDIELILTLLKSIGFRLRKDDPIMLKNLILVIQEHAGKADASNSRVRFMLDVLMAIKNNNMTKIPNYDPSHGEHLIKIIKQHFRKGNYVTELKIGMTDLLNAESKGRWWIIGSAWSNLDSEQQSKDVGAISGTTTTSTTVNKKLLAKAKKFGMNTDVRRSIFCVIMTAEDYLEAFEKLMHLGLKNQQAREMIHVLVYCCLHEKKYNPYYALILSKLCATERHFMLTLQYGLWDRLKDMTSLAPQQLDNMSRLLIDLINEKTLPLSVLKIIDFGDLKKDKLVFLKSTLGGVLLQKNKENLEEIIFKIGLSEKLHLFRESLKLFLGHFMVKQTIDVDGEEVTSTWDATSLKLLEDRIKIVENALQYSDSFKIEVTEYAKIIGQRKAARLFCVSQKRVYDWLQQETILRSRLGSEAHKALTITSTEPSSTRQEIPSLAETLKGTTVRSTTTISCKSIRQVVDIGVEEELFKWFLSLEPRPSSSQVRKKAVQMYRFKGCKEINCSYGWYRRWCDRFKNWNSKTEAHDYLIIPWILEQYDNNCIVSYSNLQSYGRSTLNKFRSGFKASLGWASRFFKRHHLLLTWDGHMDVLPQEMLQKSEVFVETIGQILSENHFKEAQVACMDEVPLSFSGSNISDMEVSPGDTQISHHRKISIKNCQATVILALRSDGFLLPPMIVVKGQQERTLNQIYVISDDNPVCVFYGNSTEPDQDCLEKWIEFVYLKHMQTPSILLCDSYNLHQELSMKLSCGKSVENSIKICTFPPGCACRLQPLNVNAKISFLKSINESWENHLRNNSKDSRIKLPSTNELAEWVRSAYDILKPETQIKILKESFRKVGVCINPETMHSSLPQ